MDITIILKILSLIAFLLLLLKIKTNISLALLILSVYSIFIFEVKPAIAARSSLDILFAETSVQLYLIITAVLFLTMVQKEEKMFDQLLSSLNSIFKNNKIVSMVAPSIIGLLPMPGGALVSAPLVEKSMEAMKTSREFKTFLNYWFRHIWEFVWPIYAGLLLFQAMSGIPLKKIIIAQAPYTLLSIVTGTILVLWYFRKNGIQDSLPIRKGTLKTTLADFIGGLWPVILIILLFFLISIPLYMALIITCVALIIIKRVTLKAVLKILFSPLIGKTMMLMASVLVFQKIISISSVFGEVKAADISFPFLIFLCFLISFSIGFLTGVNTAYIAIAFPLLFPLIRELPNFFHISIYIYVIGFAGILLSPVHLCLVLTNEYFGSDLLKVYRFLLPPVLLLMILSTLIVTLS